MKVCFIGTGSIGARHIQNLKYICNRDSIDVDISVMRSRNTPLRKSLESIINCQYYSWSDMPDTFDACFICTPTHLHGETIQNSMEFSQYFFVEKPLFSDALSFNLEDLRLPKDHFYYVACPLRYTQVFDCIQQICNDTKVYSARAISSSYLPSWRNGVDYRLSYSAHRDQGGGVNIDLIHEWDYLISLFGFPEETHQFSGQYSDLEIDSDDLAIYVSRYKDKLVEVHLDYFGKQPKRTLELYSTNGDYSADFLNNQVKRNDTVLFHFDEDLNAKYVRELEFFINNVLGNSKTNPNPIEHAYAVQRFVQSTNSLQIGCNCASCRERRPD